MRRAAPAQLYAAERLEARVHEPDAPARDLRAFAPRWRFGFVLRSRPKKFGDASAFFGPRASGLKPRAWSAQRPRAAAREAKKKGWRAAAAGWDREPFRTLLD